MKEMGYFRRGDLDGDLEGDWRLIRGGAEQAAVIVGGTG